LGSTSLVNLLTDAGDSGVLLPLAAVACAVLWLFQSHRMAWLMARSVAASSVAITVLKLFFLSCGAHLQAGLLSPSGHACLSAVVYGCLGTAAAAGRPVAVRWTIGVAVTALVGIIAFSRITLGVHTWIEVSVGLAVGVAGQQWFAWSARRVPTRRVDGRIFAAAVAATFLFAFGLRLPAESLLRHLAKRVGVSCAAAGADHRATSPPPASRSGARQAPARTSAISSASSRADWS
jgi:hypothetical protein